MSLIPLLLAGVVAGGSADWPRFRGPHADAHAEGPMGGTGDLTDRHVAWRLSRAALSTPSPLLVGDDLYFVSDKGVASAVDAKTGVVHWTERLGGNYSASPILVADRILFLDEAGRATWVRVGRTFERLEINELPGRMLATPAFAGGAMYLRTDTSLFKIAAL